MDNSTQTNANHEDVFCARPRPAPFARALTTTERGQLPSHVDVEILRGPNYDKGGKKVWPQPFADLASRWSKRGAGDARCAGDRGDERRQRNGGGSGAHGRRRATARGGGASVTPPTFRPGAYVRSRLAPSPRARACRVAPSYRAVVCASSRIVSSCHHITSSSVEAPTRRAIGRTETD